MGGVFGATFVTILSAISTYIYTHTHTIVHYTSYQTLSICVILYSTSQNLPYCDS